MGKRSQAVQRARREAAISDDDLRLLAADPPLLKGDVIGRIEFQDFRSGTIRRWSVCRGNRTNNYTLRSPDGRESKPHGMSWILERVRKVILGSAAPNPASHEY